MIEKNKKSPPTHDVYKLFTQLSEKTKDHIEKTFYDDECRKKIFESMRNTVRQQMNKEISEEDFIKILKRGEDFVKNLKYNESSFLNVLGGQHLYFLDTLRKELLEKLETMEETK